MKISSRQINLLKSCSLFLTSRSNSLGAKKFGWSYMFQSYGEELNNLAKYLTENAEVVDDPVTVDELFKGR